MLTDAAYETKFPGSVFVGVPHSQVENGIVEGPSNEPLDGEVVDPLGSLFGVVTISLAIS